MKKFDPKYISTTYSSKEWPESISQIYKNELITDNYEQETT